MIPVYRISEDGLSRQRWDFSVGSDIGAPDCVNLTLVRYCIERRGHARGRFKKADSSNQWASSDERRYASGLPRPTEIPDDVMDDAFKAVTLRFYIGWPTSEHLIWEGGAS